MYYRIIVDMKLLRTTIVFVLFILLGFAVNAEEKKLKFRGITKDSEFKQIQINISPDLLKTGEFKKLKLNYKKAKNFSIETNKNLIKKKTKFRSAKASEAKNIFKIYKNSVFFLLNTEDEGAIGTGFLVDNSGLVLSNWHVVDGAKSIFVWTHPEKGVVGTDVLFEKVEPYFGQVVAENKDKDLALIKVNGLPKNIKAVNLGSSNEVEIGDDVWAIGHPKSLPWSFSYGMVSQIRPNYKWTYKDGSNHTATVIQMQTPISTGNSGGPLFTNEGKVIGVNTLFQEGGQNLNFAIHINHVKQFIKDNPDVKNINPIGAAIKKDYPNAKTQDSNNNGVTDTWYVDTNNNGKIDTAFIDQDEDSYIEGTMFDENENGVWEILLLDTDKDGKTNKAYVDEDEDKNDDFIAHDYDQDGKWDKYEKI